MGLTVQPNATLVIRPITAADNHPLEVLIKSVMPEFGADGAGFAIHDAEVAQMYEAYTQPGCLYLVIQDDGRVVGGGGIGPLAGAPSAICELKKMYFYPEARGRGLGKQLLQKLIAAATHLDYRQCYLETLDRMESAKQLYSKFGFKELPEPWGNTGHFGCDRWYAKDLGQPN